MREVPPSFVSKPTKGPNQPVHGETEPRISPSNKRTRILDPDEEWGLSDTEDFDASCPMGEYSFDKPKVAFKLNPSRSNRSLVKVFSDGLHFGGFGKYFFSFYDLVIRAIREGRIQSLSIPNDPFENINPLQVVEMIKAIAEPSSNLTHLTMPVVDEWNLISKALVDVLDKTKLVYLELFGVFKADHISPIVEKVSSSSTLQVLKVDVLNSNVVSNETLIEIGDEILKFSKQPHVKFLRVTGGEPEWLNDLKTRFNTNTSLPSKSVVLPIPALPIPTLPTPALMNLDLDKLFDEPVFGEEILGFDEAGLEEAGLDEFNESDLEIDGFKESDFGIDGFNESDLGIDENVVGEAVKVNDIVFRTNETTVENEFYGKAFEWKGFHDEIHVLIGGVTSGLFTSIRISEPLVGISQVSFLNALLQTESNVTDLTLKLNKDFKQHLSLVELMTRPNSKLKNLTLMGVNIAMQLGSIINAIADSNLESFQMVSGKQCGCAKSALKSLFDVLKRGVNLKCLKLVDFHPSEISGLYKNLISQQVKLPDRIDLGRPSKQMEQVICSSFASFETYKNETYN